MLSEACQWNSREFEIPLKAQEKKPKQNKDRKLKREELLYSFVPEKQKKKNEMKEKWLAWLIDWLYVVYGIMELSFVFEN